MSIIQRDAALPQGIVMLLTWPDGSALAEVSDFDRSGYGGFSLHQAQRLRCKDRIGRAALDRLANPIVGECMERYHVDAWLQKLTRDKGFKLHEIAIGYAEDEA